MKSIFSLIAIASLGALVSCNKPVFIPVQGRINGIVLDNNGYPLHGVEVTAAFDPPENNSGFPVLNTVAAITASNGAYPLDEVWDRVDLRIDHPGFRPVLESVELVSDNRRRRVDFLLVGSPTVQSVTPCKTVLAETEPDTIHFLMEVQDLFNTIFAPYAGKLLLKNDRGNTELILTVQAGDQSMTQFLFEAALHAGQLSAGTYRVIAEITDPDGNFHQAQAAEAIRVE